MCQFCHQHGDGKKWYLNAANYAEDLLSDLRRRKFITSFFGAGSEIEDAMGQIERFSGAPPFIRSLIKPAIVRRMKRDHYGQVLPLEDVAQIFGFVGSIVRVPCICRHVMLHREVGTCYGVAMTPTSGLGSLFQDAAAGTTSGPDFSQFERLTTEEALAAFREHEKEGLCHTVWTFVAPFTGGICNCDRRDCLAMRSTVGHDLPVMFRGEYVASVNPDVCTGCRSCLRQCQFGAMGYSAADKKAFVEPRACYGCGICRASCAKNAISLAPRQEVPTAANLW